MKAKTTAKTTTKPKTPKADAYAYVTDIIIKDLEQGTRPWLKPWAAGNAEGRISLPLRHNGTPYRGINILLLWGAAMDGGFQSPQWMTYMQAKELGAQVRKGEVGSIVIFADRYIRIETNDKGEDTEHEIPFVMRYYVYNTEQIDGLPPQYQQAPCPAPQPLELHQAAEEFFARTGATVHHGGNRAFYSTVRDFVQMPPPETFRDALSYAAIKAHEFTHWTGHKDRNAREFGKRFGDRAYAFEELVAELGAAFLCADLGLTPEVREDHAAYLGHWLQVLKEDKQAIFSAATHAQRAVDYLHSLQEQDAAQMVT